MARKREMMWSRRLPDGRLRSGLERAALAGILTLLASDGSRAQGPPRRPVYVGVKICATCHDGPLMGDQASRWLRSQHAHAYSVLTAPEAAEIAAISGVPVEPLNSPLCLGCHATAADAEDWEKDDSFALEQGVQCEKCHGPGSEHVEAYQGGAHGNADQTRLGSPTTEDCLHCHRDKPSHVKILGPRPFDLAKSFSEIAHPTPAGARPEPSRSEASPELLAYLATPATRESDKPKSVAAEAYKTPINLAFHPDGRTLYVTCEAASSVCVIDAQTRQKFAEIKVGGQPMDIAFSRDGSRAYVTNRLDDSMSVIDVAARRVTATVPVGDEPHGVRTDREGHTIYVLNTSSDDLSVIDARTLIEEKRLSTSRSPWALSLSPDGTRMLVTNALSRLVKFREPSVSEISVLDTERQVVDDRLIVPEANLLQGVAWHPGGRFALTTLLRTKNLVPMTRMMQGWTVTNGLGLVWADGQIDQVLLDEPTLSFPDPTAIAFTPDGKQALVTSAGTDRVAVVAVDRLLEMVEHASPQERDEVLPNHLGKSSEFVVAHISTDRNPRGIVVAPDGRTAYVACALDDAITVIDMEKLQAVGSIDLGGTRTMSRARRGERLFNSAGIAFRRQLSCHTCHPDGHVDGLTYDIEADGIGLNPVDNRTLRGILDTGPFKWAGTNPSLARQCGPRLSVYFTRVQPFTPEELADLDHYISTISRPPNRYRPLGTTLTPAQRRGKLIFARTHTNDGREIPRENRCATCHFPPLYTDRQRHSVGKVMSLDVESTFDVPHLNNIYDSAPYLHNGIADSLEEIWTRYNPEDEHGVTNDMTKDQLNDLIEYLKTL